MIDGKKIALDEVYEAAEDYRESQQATLRARERFIDSIITARQSKATQQEIAERCVIDPDDPDGHHLSRQRVAQFIGERSRHGSLGTPGEPGHSADTPYDATLPSQE